MPFNGVGMDVDWARTDGVSASLIRWSCGILKPKGLTHVSRIRVAGAPTEARLIVLNSYGRSLRILWRHTHYCLSGRMRIKTDPSAGHEKELISWWSVVARYFGQTSRFTGFDLI